MGANMDMIDLSDGTRWWPPGPAIDSRECVGSSVSNGRIFYTSQASGLQVSASPARRPGGRQGPGSGLRRIILDVDRPIEP